jgi:hypothetical protein
VEESLTERLDDLEWWLRVLDRPVVDLLVPGLPADGLARYGPLPPTVVEWFAWHDGVTRTPGVDDRDLEVFPGYVPLALAEAVGMRPRYADDPVLSVGDGWLPLLASSSGDLLAAVWRGAFEPRVAAVRSGDPTRIEFPDVATMIEFFVECFRRGGCTVGPNGALTADEAIYDELYADLTSRY